MTIVHNMRSALTPRRRNGKRIAACGLQAKFIGAAALLSCASALAQSPCTESAARAASVEGHVQVKTRSADWVAVKQDQELCAGDVVRVLERSRAGLVLRNDVLLRLDENTVLTVGEARADQPTILKMVQGWLHIITRHRKQFRVTTPFVNAVVEGTEFTVSAESQASAVLVTEGQVRMENPQGSLRLQSGEAGLAKVGVAPAPYPTARPRDAVQWALYFPPVLQYRPSPTAAEREAAQLAGEGDVNAALERLASIPPGQRNAELIAFQASLLLSVGRVQQARALLDGLERNGQASGDSLALQAVVELVMGDRSQAAQLIDRAEQFGAPSAAVLIAKSYVQQAEFQLEDALASARRAAEIDADNAIAWSRIADLQLSTGAVRGARAAAERAVQLSPRFSRGHTVLGYVLLREGTFKPALASFNTAIGYDQADPLPRLGRGIARIRQGELAAGRQDIEIAVLLDPTNSLARSYLGKAYFDEKRDRLAGTEFDLGKELDPRDPTPWYYDAIRKQTENRPGEALEDLQRSIELNDNRAVYRSRLLLDQDAAARGASIARVYQDLGFEQLAVTEGANALTIDPTAFSAHRFLADAYQPLPRYEIARVSETLQSQLLQPAGAAPFAPRLGQTRAPIVEAEGPITPSFQELNPLFNRDRFVFFLSGVAGENNTFGDEAMIAAVHGNQALRLGQLHYQTDGFRDGADLSLDAYDVFYQNDITWNTSVQAQLTFGSSENGDITQRIDDTYKPLSFQQSIDGNTLRLGFRHSSSPDAQWLVSLIRREEDTTQDQSDALTPGDPSMTLDRQQTIDQLVYQGELQYLRRIGRWGLTAGLGTAYVPKEDALATQITVPFPPFVIPLDSGQTDSTQRFQNAYLYASWNPTRALTLVAGLAYDRFEDSVASNISNWNPKLGLSWQVTDRTTLRLAGFRALKRPLAANATIEPTQVAGFNQLFDDFNGTESTRYAIALDHRFGPKVFAGLEASWRTLKVPVTSAGGGASSVEDRTEQLYRGYVSALLTRQLSLSIGVTYDDQQRDIPASQAGSFPLQVRTLLAPIQLSWFHPSGWFARVVETLVDQQVEQIEPAFTGSVVTVSSRFALTDFSVGYRLPKRWGIISLDVRNLFDRQFGYQDTDFAGNPRIPLFQPGRTVLLRFSLYH